MSKTRWNDIPFDPNADPQTKADEFDAQLAENAAEAEEKREKGEYPYDLDSK